MKVVGNENDTVTGEMCYHLSVRTGGQQVLPAEQEHMDIHTITQTAVLGPHWQVHNMHSAVSVLG